MYMYIWCNDKCLRLPSMNTPTLCKSARKQDHIEGPYPTYPLLGLHFGRCQHWIMSFFIICFMMQDWKKCIDIFMIQYLVKIYANEQNNYIFILSQRIQNGSSFSYGFNIIITFVNNILYTHKTCILDSFLYEK